MSFCCGNLLPLRQHHYSCQMGCFYRAGEPSAAGLLIHLISVSRMLGVSLIQIFYFFFTTQMPLQYYDSNQSICM